jgi:hypothetical protein
MMKGEQEEEGDLILVNDLILILRNFPKKFLDFNY